MKAKFMEDMTAPMPNMAKAAFDFGHDVGEVLCDHARGILIGSGVATSSKGEEVPTGSISMADDNGGGLFIVLDYETATSLAAGILHMAEMIRDGQTETN